VYNDLSILNKIIEFQIPKLPQGCRWALDLENHLIESIKITAKIDDQLLVKDMELFEPRPFNITSKTQTDPNNVHFIYVKVYPHNIPEYLMSANVEITIKFREPQDLIIHSTPDLIKDILITHNIF